MRLRKQILDVYLINVWYKKNLADKEIEENWLYKSYLEI